MQDLLLLTVQHLLWSTWHRRASVGVGGSSQTDILLSWTSLTIIPMPVPVKCSGMIRVNNSVIDSIIDTALCASTCGCGNNPAYRHPFSSSDSCCDQGLLNSRRRSLHRAVRGTTVSRAFGTLKTTSHRLHWACAH
jgi:hypothetical protein